MSEDRRQVWQTLTGLILRLEEDIERLGLGGDNGRYPPATPTPAADLESLEKEIRKLGRTQFKANTLAESQQAQTEQLLATWEKSQTEEQAAREAQLAQQAAVARHEVLLAFLPALDSVEHALNSGQRYLALRDKAAERAAQTPTQAQLVSPTDRAMLAGWLDGLQLTRERLLAVLEAGGVTPIPTVGHPFDPYLHRAVGVTAVGSTTPNTIVAEERAGYQSPAGILRYADVIVYRPATR